MRNILCIACIFLCCISCTKSAKKKIGMGATGPNESIVLHHPKLSIPSEFTLPDISQKEDTDLENNINKENKK